VGDRRRWRPDRRHRADADGDGRAVVVVTIAYLKTEPIQVAIFGLIFLGDAVTWPMMTAILVATAGVLIMSAKPGGMVGGVKPTLIGWLQAACSPCRHRLPRRDPRPPHAELRHAATFTLVVGLVMQAVTLSLYLLIRAPAVLAAIGRAWKPSLFAGLMGAFASQFWFLAFAIATAASVRTLALIEVLFAQFVARFMFGQRTSVREAAGMVLVVAGVVLLILAH